MTDQPAEELELEEELTELAAVAPARRRDNPLFLALVILAIVVLSEAAFAGWLIHRDGQDAADRRDSDRRTECISRATGQALGYAFEALAAPPAPNRERLKKVRLGLEAARVLQDPDRFCP